jgi:hypothetical protein
MWDQFRTRASETGQAKPEWPRSRDSDLILTPKAILLILATICSTVPTGSAAAEVCTPPPGFIDKQHPPVAAPSHLVAHQEEVTVAQPLVRVLETNAKVSLKEAIHKAGALPGVTGEYSLGNIPFPNPGARRMVCLSDGSTLQEQSLEEEHTTTFYRFRYIVWHYTSPQAHLSNTVSESFVTHRSTQAIHTLSGPTPSSSKTIHSQVISDALAATSSKSASSTEITQP